jgi:hypothetical protein
MYARRGGVIKGEGESKKGAVAAIKDVCEGREKGAWGSRCVPPQLGAALYAAAPNLACALGFILGDRREL